MPKFPKREADILALADVMIAGYAAHAADFPSHTTIPPWVIITRSQYLAVKNDQTEAMAATQVATDEKDTALAGLAQKMKAELKKSEVDAGANSEKLEYIGWGPKAPPSPGETPGQPRNLDAAVQGAGTVLLDWKAPARGSGGTVRTYCYRAPRPARRRRRIRQLGAGGHRIGKRGNANEPAPRPAIGIPGKSNKHRRRKPAEQYGCGRFVKA